MRRPLIHDEPSLPLLDLQYCKGRFLICCLIFLGVAFLQHGFFHTTEIPVGAISVGSMVRTKRIFGFRLGLVSNIIRLSGPSMGDCVEMFFFNKADEEPVRATVYLRAIDEIPSTPFEPTPENAWPYWNIIRQDPWLTQQTCMGPLPGYCSLNEHDCENAYVAFFDRIAPTLHQHPRTILFEYENSEGGDDQPEQELLMTYVRTLMQGQASRLYCVKVSTHHTFLIEQYGSEFRIYQSWTHGFDLKFWTDPNVPITEICEPGHHYEANLQDPSVAWMMARVGIVDDKESIEAARQHYGSLRSVSFADVMQLFEAIAFGFEIEALNRRVGQTSLVPAAQAMRKDTKRWLGKSAVQISRMLGASEEDDIDFSIFVAFIETSSTSWSGADH